MKNDKEEIKNHLKEYVERITEPDRKAGKNMYKCPLCGSGTHGGRNSNGAFSVKGTSWHCFACCQSGDIFDLVQATQGLTDFKGQLEYLQNEFNLVDEPKKEAKPAAEPKADYTGYIRKCAENANKTDYFEQRGFTPETVKRFSLGYDVARTAIVIPYGMNNRYYITRSTQDKIFRKPPTDQAGTEPIYNQGALYSGNPAFVCESPLDAISIMQAGGSAVSLGGTGWRKLTAVLEGKAPSGTLILCLDNDKPGKDSSKALADELQKMEIGFIFADFSLEKYSGDKKDSNDLLKANSAQFAADVAQNIERANRLIEEENEKTLAEYKRISGAERLKDFINGISTRADTAYTPTGFKLLDRELDGGLYAGLYIIGAVSSLGKTTISLQIADQIAEAGKDVLIFSLEMAADELISKSISRLTYELAADKTGRGESRSAKTARGITSASRYKDYSQTEKDLINQAIESYGKIAGHIYIHEGIGDIGAVQIREAVEQHRMITGNTPVVLVDYLQILAPYNDRCSDKQNTDKAVLELKRMSRDYKTAVLGISSYNRNSYNTAASMESFKESGAIEYGSDVLIALQPFGMEVGASADDSRELMNNCKANLSRDLEAVILKNRNGKTGGKIRFTYSAMFNHFEERARPCDFEPDKNHESPFDVFKKDFT